MWKTVIFVSINPAPVSHIFYPLETTCSFCLSAGVTAPRRSVCMSAAKVQLECTTIDTSEPQIQKHVHIMEHMVITTINLSGHHTYSHARAAVPHRSPYLHVDTSAHTHTNKDRDNITNAHCSHIYQGTPVSLLVPIVVHLAVLCSTLCSQHECHLKSDTYGPASCWSDTSPLFFSGVTDDAQLRSAPFGSIWWVLFSLTLKSLTLLSFIGRSRWCHW